MARRATRARSRSGSATARATQFQLDVYGEVLDALYQARGAGCRPTTAPGRSLAAPAREPRDALARARRGHLGGARPAPPLHPLEGDGLGRVRPRRCGRSRSSAARAQASAGARSATRSTPRCSSAASTRSSARSSSPTARSARREPADDPALRLPARRRPARARHGRGDPARAARGRLRPALPARHNASGRRPAAGRGHVLAVLLLVRRQPGPARGARRGARDVRAAARAAERPRAAVRGVRPDAGRLVGNFPQAFSHIGLVNTALRLDAALSERDGG